MRLTFSAKKKVNKLLFAQVKIRKLTLNQKRSINETKKKLGTLPLSLFRVGSQSEITVYTQEFGKNARETCLNMPPSKPIILYKR